MSLTDNEELRLKAIESRLNTFQKAIKNLASKEELKQLLLVKETVEVELRQIVDETVSIPDLLDTTLQLPVENNQILRYDSTEQKWKNVDLSSGGGGGGGSGVSFLGELTDVAVAASNILPDQSVISYSSANDEWQNILIFESTNLADGTSNNITLVPQDQGTVKVASDYKDRTEFDDNALTPKGYVDAEVGRFSPIGPPDFPDTQTLFLVTTSGGSTPQTAIGNNPKLCSGVIPDNSFGQTPPASAGDSVLRIPTGTLLNTNIVTAVGPGNKGLLTAIANGIATGQISFTDNNDSQTNGNLIVLNNLDFPEIFPGFHMVFDAHISNWQPAGLNVAGWGSLVLQHSETSALETYFVIDDMTANPAIVNPSAASITEGSPGTSVNITGIPHYSQGATVNMSGLEMSAITGETYYDGFPIVIHTNKTSSGVSSNNKSYENIGSPGEIINGIHIPAIDVGFLVLNSLEYSMNPTDSIGEVHLALTLKNTNGTVTTEFPGQKILLSPSSAAIDGIDELGGIRVIGLGSQPNSGKAIRGETGSGDTPSIDPSISLNHDQSLVGDLETAITVGGVLEHSVEDFSTRLPVGPDLSQTPGRAGGQYATYKFQRTPVSKFDIDLTGTVAGLWVSLPGISTSDENNWLDMSQSYAGNGAPGQNGSNGCALAGTLQLNTSGSQRVTCTFGTLSSSNVTNNHILVRLKFTAGQKLTQLVFREASN